MDDELHNFILDENHNLIPVDVSTWAHWMEDIEKRKIALDEVHGMRISTVCLGLLNCLFETCIFTPSGSQVIEKYKTYQDALEGHKKWVKLQEK